MLIPVLHAKMAYILVVLLQALEVHERRYHRPQCLYRCKFCTATFTEESATFRHYTTFHLSVRRWICGVCAKQYANSQDLSKHLTTKHSLKMGKVLGKHRKSNVEVSLIHFFTIFSLCSRDQITDICCWRHGSF